MLLVLIQISFTSQFTHLLAAVSAGCSCPTSALLQRIVVLQRHKEFIPCLKMGQLCGAICLPTHLIVFFEIRLKWTITELTSLLASSSEPTLPPSLLFPF